MKENYTYALKLLAARGYFAGELERALNKKFPGGDNGAVVERLKSCGYLDDDKLLRDYVRWKALSGHGEYYIKEKLSGKGVTVTAGAVRAVIGESGVDIDAVVRNLIDKYRRVRNKLAPPAFQKACLRYLTGRGYALGDCLKILSDEGIQDESDFFEGC